MGVVAFVREKFARALPAVRQARVVSTWQADKPLPKSTDYKTFASELARKNVIVASCIWEIVTSACEPELVAERRTTQNGKDVWTRLPDSHDLATLLRQPNPDESSDELLERLLTHQQIGGQWNLRYRATWKRHCRPPRRSATTPRTHDSSGRSRV